MSLYKVAEVAGVSAATVSRIMNGLPGASLETVARVQAVIADMKYVPRRGTSRRALPKRKAKWASLDVAVLTVGQNHKWLELPIISSVVDGIKNGARLHGVDLSFGDVMDESEVNAVAADRKAVGAIVFASSYISTDQIDTIIRGLKKRGPVVWVMGNELLAGEVDHVMPDNVAIGQLAFQHLRGMGCKRLAYLASTPRWPLIRLRGQAFTNAAFDAGIDVGVFIKDKAGDQPFSTVYGPTTVVRPTMEELVKQLASGPFKPDGIFLSNDMTAAAAYPLLQQLNVGIGRDVHVISCDNEQERLAGLIPRPLSIDIGAQEIGFRAISRLINRVERPSGPALVIQVLPRLIRTAYKSA